MCWWRNLATGTSCKTLLKTLFIRQRRCLFSTPIKLSTACILVQLCKRRMLAHHCYTDSPFSKACIVLWIIHQSEEGEPCDASTQHEQRRWPDLKQILETPSAHALRKQTATWNTIFQTLPFMPPLPHTDTVLFLSHICITGLHLEVFALHSPFLYLDKPFPVLPPSNWLRLFSSQTFSCKNIPPFSSWLFFLLTLSMKMEQTVFQNTGIKNSDAGESSKRINTTIRTQAIFEIKAHYIYIEGVTGGKDQTSGGCSLC